MRVLLVEDLGTLPESFAWSLRYAGCEVAAKPVDIPSLQRRFQRGTFREA